MNIFFFLFTSVLLATHAYLFWSLKRILGGGRWQWLFILFCLAVVALRFGRSWFLDNPKWLVVLDVFNYWLAFLIVASVCLFAADLLRIFAWLFDKLAGTSLGYWLASARSGRYVLVLCLLAFAYSLYEARAIRIRHVVIASDLLPPGRDQVRIAVLADIHLDRLIQAGNLEKMAALANAQKPDLVALVGDIIDGDMDQSLEEAAIFRAMHGPEGKFVVFGNHEVYSGLAQAARFFDNAGLILLRGESVETAGIVVAGVDDPAVKDCRDSAAVLAGTDQSKFVLLLSHRPDIPEAALGCFDLQLSGHTHGGQIFPGILFVRTIFYPYPQGLSSLAVPDRRNRKQSKLYLSNGTGFWGPPARLGAPPEIAVIDIVRH